MKPGSEATIFNYAYTLKKNSNAHQFVSKEDYDKILCQVYARMCATQYCFEIDSKDTLHYHSYIQTTSRLRYTDFRYPGYRSYFRLLKTPSDVFKWRNYLTKSTQYSHPDEVHWINRSKHEYMFRDEVAQPVENRDPIDED